MNIVQRIVSTFLNWELFSDKEINDATRAFNHLASSFHFSCFSDDGVIKQIMKIVGSHKIPQKIKISTVSSFKVVNNFRFIHLT